MIYKDATLSFDGVYRYTLLRSTEEPDFIDRADAVNFIMLNPSTADAELDDPTIRRCMGFAWEWGYKQLIVTNLFALRATDPKALYKHPDPVCEQNDKMIRVVASSCEKVVCAWGTHGAYQGRGKEVLRMLNEWGCRPYHLGLTKGGFPKHPLYLPSSTKPEKFS